MSDGTKWYVLCTACILLVGVVAAGGWSAVATTTGIDLTAGATDDGTTVEGGAVDRQMNADTSDTDVQLFLDLNRNGTVDNGEPTLTVSASELGTGSFVSAAFSGLSVPTDGTATVTATAATTEPVRETPPTTEGEAPGFGIVVALAALVATLALKRQRR